MDTTGNRYVFWEHLKLRRFLPSKNCPPPPQYPQLIIRNLPPPFVVSLLSFFLSSVAGRTYIDRYAICVPPISVCVASGRLTLAQRNTLRASTSNVAKPHSTSITSLEEAILPPTNLTKATLNNTIPQHRSHKYLLWSHSSSGSANKQTANARYT